MASQDWFEKDFYKVLGVPKDADAAAIKKSYRKLARQYHPDQNPGDSAAEAKFKEVGEAYGVLSDPAQRKEYDAIRAMAGGGPRFARGSGGPAGQGGGFEDLFSGMFGGGRGGNVRFETSGDGAPDLEDLLKMFGGGGRSRGGGFGGFGGFASQPQQGADLHAATTISFRQAATGEQVTLSVDGRSINVRIPAGVKNGQKIKLKGKGHPGSNGGPAGDMVISVTVTPHPLFAMESNNLRMNLPVTFAEAALGATVEVPTLDGQTVRVKVPAGTPSGRVLRVKGHGITTKKGTGDLLLQVEIQVPRHLSDDAREAIAAFESATNDDPRANLADRARA
ncbi:molecular chaperone DnaJ [Bowdeniella nasicola]|uniref:Molecular chaperone DnaJ n=1 Tax=Bowdeniella nasicola TaxID=208480 RepID=A0A1Q5Q0Z9_9ACTO|nr:DnaJ C-terminal domain-containing protein [Bowdeniella nasicola]OKL53389.1 molecular chaperone DnaJ [Bowdeniella nasicola]